MYVHKYYSRLISHDKYSISVYRFFLKIIYCLFLIISFYISKIYNDTQIHKKKKKELRKL